MATKTALYNALKDKVLACDVLRTTGNMVIGLVEYQVHFIMVVDSIAMRRFAVMLVKDDGQASEEAYWDGLPEPLKVLTLRERIEANTTFQNLSGKVLEVRGDKAIVSALVGDPPTEEVYLVWLDAQSNLSTKKITSYYRTVMG